jgi:RND family efflux transporter MFP subunit
MRLLVSADFFLSFRHVQRLLPWLGALLVSLASAQGGVQVPVALVQIRSVGTGFELDGVVQPVKQSTVSAQASGRIARLLVKAGDKVRAGQVLATIDDREAQTGVQSSQAQVAQAQAGLQNAQANFERTRDLRAKGFVSAAAVDSADAQLKAALAGRDQAGAGARQSALMQGFTRVTAPFDAWVLQTQVEAGDLALPGKPLLSLYAPLPVRVVVQVPVSRSGLASSAGVVEVLLPGAAMTVQWIRPSAISIVPTADPVSQTIEWRLELPAEAARSWLPGQQVRVRFAGGQAQRLLVPLSAVLQRGELTAVYVAVGKGFALKPVRLGGAHGAAGVEVLAGLTAGEQVALDPVKAGLTGAQPVGAVAAGQ